MGTNEVGLRCSIVTGRFSAKLVEVRNRPNEPLYTHTGQGNVVSLEQINSPALLRKLTVGRLNLIFAKGIINLC